ncbi:hypothetical protein OHA10_23065 [Kribbella sp. NBC_00662]|uniref:hypothetical protein n=1 Tax=Kribbella sp. NBC_00662 TaxID=2975969 RepID=UPI003250D8AB
MDEDLEVGLLGDRRPRNAIVTGSGQHGQELRQPAEDCCEFVEHRDDVGLVVHDNVQDLSLGGELLSAILERIRPAGEQRGFLWVVQRALGKRVSEECTHTFDEGPALVHVHESLAPITFRDLAERCCVPGLIEALCSSDPHGIWWRAVLPTRQPVLDLLALFDQLLDPESLLRGLGHRAILHWFAGLCGISADVWLLGRVDAGQDALLNPL